MVLAGWTNISNRPNVEIYTKSKTTFCHKNVGYHCFVQISLFIRIFLLYPESRYNFLFGNNCFIQISLFIRISLLYPDIIDLSITLCFIRISLLYPLIIALFKYHYVEAQVFKDIFLTILLQTEHKLNWVVLLHLARKSTYSSSRISPPPLILDLLHINSRHTNTS